MTHKPFLISLPGHIGSIARNQQPLYYYLHLKADSKASDLDERSHFDEGTQLLKRAVGKTSQFPSQKVSSF